MKTILILGLLTSAFLFTGCETVVEQRHPARYGRVYHQPDYYDGRYDSRRNDRYYDNGPRSSYYDNSPRRTYYDNGSRDVTLVNRELNVRNVTVPRNVERSRTISRSRSTPRQTVVVRKKKHRKNDDRNRDNR